MIGGAANLARFGTDFPRTIQPVLEALEEQVVLLKLLGEAHDPTTVHVKIGEENSVEGLRSTSVVTVGYGPDQGVYGGLGVVGSAESQLLDRRVDRFSLGLGNPALARAGAVAQRFQESQ